MKRFFSLFLAAFLVLSMITAVSISAESEISVFIDGKKIAFDQPPVIIDGRTLVPLRALFEALGAKVEWNDEAQSIYATKENLTISLNVGKRQAFIGVELVLLDVPPMLINDRTLVPLRFIGETFGCEVSWDENTNSVSITSKQSETFPQISDQYFPPYYPENELIPNFGMYVHTDNYSMSREPESIIMYTYNLGDYPNYMINDGIDGYLETLKEKGYTVYKTDPPLTMYKNNYTNETVIVGYDAEYKTYYVSFYEKTNGNQLSDSFVDNSGNSSSELEKEKKRIIDEANKKLEAMYQKADEIYEKVLQEEIAKAYAVYKVDPNDSSASFKVTNAHRQVTAMMPALKEKAEYEMYLYLDEESARIEAWLVGEIRKLEEKYGVVIEI